MLPAWLLLVLALAWLILFRIRHKRAGRVRDASISAGGLRDLGGRGGF